MKTKYDLEKEYKEFSAYESSETAYSGNATITISRYDNKTERIPNNNFKIDDKSSCAVFGVGGIV